MKVKLLLGSLVGVAALAGWKSKHRSHKTPAEKMRNDEGVGSTHISRVPRGEEQMTRKGSSEVTTVAGRVAGSIHPQSRGPGGPNGHGSRWGRGARARKAAVRTSPAVVAGPAASLAGGPGGSSRWATSFAPTADRP